MVPVLQAAVAMNDPSQIDAHVCHPADLSGDQIGQWNALRTERADWANPLLGPGFARAVGRVRPDARVMVVSTAGREVAFWAFHQRPGGLGRPIGAPFSDYHGLISEPGLSLTANALLEAAGLRRFRHGGLLDPTPGFDRLAPGQPGYAIVLDGNVEAYLEGLRIESPKRFKNLRRLRNRLEELGPVRITASRDPADFAALTAWKQAQFRRTGAHDVLRPLWVKQLFENLFIQDETDGVSGLMLTLHAGDTLVAGHFGVREGAVFHPWIASNNPEHAAFSPGQAFLYYAILAMPDLGLTTYDLGTGHDHYKRPFANVLRPTLQGDTTRLGVLAEEDSASFASRMRRRLDHIAATDQSLSGRLQGVIASALAIQKRNAIRAGAAPD